MNKIVFTRFGQEYKMTQDDLVDMLNRIACPLHPCGRTFSEINNKSEYE